MITISIEAENTILSIRPEGRLDTLNSSQFDQTIKPLAEKELYLIVDFSECNYLSSTGIRILLATFKKLKAKGGLLFIAGISTEVFQVLEMAGLHQFFQFYKDVVSARAEINRLNQKKQNNSEWEICGQLFHFFATENEKKPALTWKNQGIAGYNELGFSVGIGFPAESKEMEADAEGLFITTGNCAGFIPANESFPPDFRIPHNPVQAGILVKQAISFGNNSIGRVCLANPGTIQVGQLVDALNQMKVRINEGNQLVMAFVIANFSETEPTITFCLELDDQTIGSLKQKNIPEFPSSFLSGNNDTRIIGAQFVLDEIIKPHDLPSLQSCMKESLTIENIITVKTIELSDSLTDPIVWILGAESLEDASLHRISIDGSGEDFAEPYKAFLTRRLYADSSRVELKKLHGGYSAQTFQVTSYDKDGRKLRPTVLKFANRAMITREADRCRKYSLPYILNNSAMVLGTEFYGDCGALCYNFVGIGGEQTQLKWLTHYFENWSVEQLEPLFDKTFLQILKPWYGQPVNETIFPFRDHNPTFTFFPHIFDTAKQLFSISSDEEYFTVEETGQKLVNPYWFLKHEYKRRRETAIDYQTTICHGDLNMQNILLDQDMNVYLIDFSETRPRSIISDFARLEAIFMIEYAPLENKMDLMEMLKFANTLYNIDSFDNLPENNYQGNSKDLMNKNFALTLKMRDYAFKSTGGDERIAPYYLALLEWVLPVICYFQLPYVKKRYAMIVSALLCEKVRTLLPQLSNNCLSF